MDEKLQGEFHQAIVNALITNVLNFQGDDKPPIFLAQVANVIMGELGMGGNDSSALFHQMLLEGVANALTTHSFNSGLNFGKNVLEMVIFLDSQQDKNRQVNTGFLHKLSQNSKILCFQYLS